MEQRWKQDLGVAGQKVWESNQDQSRGMRIWRRVLALFWEFLSPASHMTCARWKGWWVEIRRMVFTHRWWEGVGNPGQISSRVRVTEGGRGRHGPHFSSAVLKHIFAGSVWLLWPTPVVEERQIVEESQSRRKESTEVQEWHKVFGAFSLCPRKAWRKAAGSPTQVDGSEPDKCVKSPK